MTTIRMATLVTALLVSVATASAQDQKDAGKSAAPPPAAAGAPPALPAPPPELETAFKPFEGHWKCDTRFPAGSMGPDSPEMTTRATVKIKKDKDLGGFWYRGDYDIKKTKTMPGFKGTFFLGVEPGSKQAMMVAVDNMGGMGTATGPLSGENLTFTGTGYMMGQKVATRETMTKKGEKEVFHRYEVDLGKGFQTMGEDTCKK